jgi:hypothetical protein
MSLLIINIRFYIIDKNQIWSFSNGNVCMGRTIPSYRRAIESEISEWKNMKKALRIQYARTFDQLMNACRTYASVGGMATRPILFESMIMTMLLHLELSFIDLEKRLDRIQIMLTHKPIKTVNPRFYLRDRKNA